MFQELATNDKTYCTYHLYICIYIKIQLPSIALTNTNTNIYIYYYILVTLINNQIIANQEDDTQI